MQNARTIKQLVSITILSMLTLGAAQAQEATVVPQGTSSLTRQQVVEDLHAWRDAGLADEWHHEQTPDIESPAYRAKYAQYLRLTGLHGAAGPATSSSPAAAQR